MERLRVRVAASPDGVDLPSFRRAIEVAMDPGDYVDYTHAYGWSEDVDRVIDSLERLLEGGHPDAVIELTEHALVVLEEASGLVDDSDGHVGVLVARLEDLHLLGCERGQPDPEALAERLLRRQLDADLEVFVDATDTYAGVLGEGGLTRYAELARAEWDQVPALGPGDDCDFGRRYRITAVMTDLAGGGGDVDALVDVIRRDLSLPYGFLQIGEACWNAGRHDDAIDWVERGIEAFPDGPDHRLHLFLARAYADRGRHADALEIAWDHFVDQPSLDTYRELKPFAERMDEWPRRRERALGLLRKCVTDARAEAGRRGFGWARAYDHSTLVRILLWEGEDESAWREAEAGGCDEALWLELAERRKEAHPEDSMRVYRERIEPTISRMTKRDYRDAVALIERVGEQLRRLGRDEELPALVAEIRAAHARKRNLIALLDEIRPEAAVAQRD
jgi:tetratricopeptide (TPR) repeat protein